MTLFRYFLFFVGLLLWLNPACAQPAKPGLFVLSIGVSTYKNPKYNLKYAHKDALDLADAWRKQTDLYDVREVKTLVNEQATRANIRAALADLKKKVSPTSLLVFVFSGHGLNDALVTHEFDNDDRTATTLGRSDLTQQLSTLGGSYIALIDACHSGSFAKNFSGGKDISTESRVQQDAAIGSMLRALSAPDKANIVIGSSSSSEKSDECDACQNGYFTQCLLDAFEGKPVVDGQRMIRPDVDGNGYIETNELDPYIKEAVFFATRTNPFPQNVLAQQTIGYNFSILKLKNANGGGKPVAYGGSGSGGFVAPLPDLGRSVIGEAKSVSFRAENVPIERLKDTDHDNVPDDFDYCLDQLGELRYWGCATDPDAGSKWSQQHDGAIPTGAVQVGVSPDGKPRYLARTRRGLGYIERGSRTAKIFSQWYVADVNVYDVLHKGKFRWQTVSGNPPGNFVPQTVKLPTTAIVRAEYEGEVRAGYWTVLPVEKRNNMAYLHSGKGKPYEIHTFSILVDEDVPPVDMSGATAANTTGVGKDIQSVLTRNICNTCHHISKRLTGPSYTEIARRNYSSEQLIDLIYNPKPGNWPGYSAMPAMQQVSRTEAWQMAAWINSLPTYQKEKPSIQPVVDVRIVRWKSPITGDFETLREDFNADAQLQSWGYKDKIYQFSAYKTRPNDPNVTVVNRWVMPNCAASIVIAEHEIPDATLLSWGYKSKQFLFFAYRNKPATGDFIAVNRWINAKPQGDPCRDFTLTVAETELTDAQLRSWGYSEKRLQFYVPRP